MFDVPPVTSPWTVRLDSEGVRFVGSGVKIVAKMIGARTPEVELSLRAIENLKHLQRVKGKYTVRQRSRHPKLLWIYGQGVKLELRFPVDPPRILVWAIRDTVQHRLFPGSGRSRNDAEDAEVADAKQARYREVVARRAVAPAAVDHQEPTP